MPVIVPKKTFRIDNMEWIILILVVGAIAGWLAGTLYKGSGSGLLLNIVLGIVGAVVGSFVFDLLNISPPNIVGSIIIATVGAIIVLWLYNRFFK